MSKPVAKIAIIGASYLQKPLVLKAKELGLETHVFAWREGNVVDDICDYYYPISILDKEDILGVCQKVRIDGIISIASDIAMPTVNYIAEKLGLLANSLEATRISTDKFEMRSALSQAGIPCPKFARYDRPNFEDDSSWDFPLIVKPTDRSGSRGVTKVTSPDEVNEAISKALANSLKGHAIVESLIVGREFSVEIISFNGLHYPLIITDKVTSGSPHFVEMGHHQPATISAENEENIFRAAQHALDVLGIWNGASHTEVFLTATGDIRIVEVAGRMGGDLIGSHMVYLSTGFDFVRAVIEVAMGTFKRENYPENLERKPAGVHYVIPPPGKIVDIKNNAEKFPGIHGAYAISKVGDIVEPINDGAGKRVGVIVYNNAKFKDIKQVNNVLEFQTSPLTE